MFVGVERATTLLGTAQVPKKMWNATTVTRRATLHVTARTVLQMSRATTATRWAILPVTVPNMRTKCSATLSFRICPSDSFVCLLLNIFFLSLTLVLGLSTPPLSAFFLFHILCHVVT